MANTIRGFVFIFMFASSQLSAMIVCRPYSDSRGGLPVVTQQKIDALGDQGKTLLMVAYENNNIDQARVLLEAGANPFYLICSAFDSFEVRKGKVAFLLLAGVDIVRNYRLVSDEQLHDESLLSYFDQRAFYDARFLSIKDLLGGHVKSLRSVNDLKQVAGVLSFEEFDGAAISSDAKSQSSSNGSEGVPINVSRSSSFEEFVK